jgi:DNA topoisomerase-1
MAIRTEYYPASSFNNTQLTDYMQNKLLIVESPGKIKTIKKYLGPEWSVMPSIGHVADLPRDALGILKDQGFKPVYRINPDKQQVIRNLTSYIRTVGKENVYLATDEDREGEAIAYHLCQFLNLDVRTTHRVTFNEITQPAIQKALTKPRVINLALVAAQEARRVIDRLVGFEVSPVLWKKINSEVPLSAGRVQSVAVKLVVEREREIEEYVPMISFKLTGVFKTVGGSILKATSKKELLNEDAVRAYFAEISGLTFRVTDIAREPRKVYPPPPFCTSTLQQDGNKKLKFSVSRTMQVAQKLYEAGHITYMRTDSVNLSETAQEMIRERILALYDESYLELRTFKNKNKAAQEAHEAIRPTDFTMASIEGTADEQALYGLIYHRAMASQMSPKRLLSTIITFDSSRATDAFEARASVVLFEGFAKVYQEIQDGDDEDDEETQLAENVEIGEPLQLQRLKARQRYTKPKGRYSQADLVRVLEELGIGRPSTYASILKNIIETRGYLAEGNRKGKLYPLQTLLYEGAAVTGVSETVVLGQSSGKLIPNPLAYTVIDVLQKHFEPIMNYTFTSGCEDRFDQIAQGSSEYAAVVTAFDRQLKELLSSAAGHPDAQATPSKTTCVGEYEGEVVRVGQSEHGAYVLHRKKFYSLPADCPVESVSLEQAIGIIDAKRKELWQKEAEQAQNTLHVVGKFKIINGQYGPYVTDGSKSAPIPKSDLTALDLYDAVRCQQTLKEYQTYKKKKK